MTYVFAVRVSDKKAVEPFINRVHEKKKEAVPITKVTMSTELMEALDLYLDVEKKNVKIIATEQIDRLEKIKKLAEDAGLLDGVSPLPPITEQGKTKSDKLVNKNSENEVMYA